MESNKVMRLRMGCGLAKSGGFSLLEVLVAFVILAGVTTAIFSLIAGALRNSGTAEEYSRALLLAESRLAALAEDKVLREGTQRGSDADPRFTWEVAVTPYVPPGNEPPTRLDVPTPLLPFRLLHATVTVRWPGLAGNERTVSLSTVRLAAKE